MNIGDIEYPSLKGTVSDEEWQTRQDLAAVFRLMLFFGWWDLAQAPAAARVPGTPHFLFLPRGILFEEVTASCLVKVDLNGRKVAPSPFDILEANWLPFKAVFQQRADATWALHSHDEFVTAIAARKEGLLPISQSAAIALGAGVAVHGYDGIEIVEERNASLMTALGDGLKRYILQNHGLVTIGYSARELIFITANLAQACRIQVLAGAGDELVHIDREKVLGVIRDLSLPGKLDNLWPALLRKLDRLDPSWRN